MEPLDVDRVGLTWLRMDDDDRLIEHGAQLTHWLQGRKVQTWSDILTRGSTLYWETTVRPVLASAGRAEDIAIELQAGDSSRSALAFITKEPEGWLVVLVPYDQRKKLQDDLRKVAVRSAEQRAEIERLEEADETRTALVNAIAHELATPMTPIQLELSMLRSKVIKAEDPKVQAALDRLQGNVVRLQSFVDKVTQATRQQAGKIVCDPQPGQVDRVVKKQVQEWGAQYAPDRQFHLHTVPTKAMFHDECLQEALVQILENAVRYSPPGSDIEVSVRSDPPVVQVLDHGRGIDPSRAERLGRPFTKAHRDQDDARLGAGLGLFIVDGMMRAQGGSWAIRDPDEGQGTVVELRLQAVAKASQVNGDPKAASRPQDSLRAEAAPP